MGAARTPCAREYLYPFPGFPNLIIDSILIYFKIFSAQDQTTVYLYCLQMHGNPLSETKPQTTGQSVVMGSV